MAAPTVAESVVLSNALFGTRLSVEVLRCCERVVPQPGGARRGRGCVQGAVRTAVDLSGYPRTGVGRRSPFREQLHDARHRVGAEERRVRAAHHFHAFEVLGRQVGEVEGAARLVERDAVEQHRVVVALAAAHEQAGHTAGRAGLDDRGARRGPHQVHDEGRLTPRYVLRGKRRRCDAHLARRHLGPRGGDDDGLFDRCDRQLDAERAGGAGDAGGTESGQRRLDLAALREVQREAAGFVGEDVCGVSGRGWADDPDARARQRAAVLVDDDAVGGERG